jgi:hypothetical protein
MNANDHEQGSAAARDLLYHPSGEPGDGTLPAHSADGVDLGLIRWSLNLIPAQRLETLQSFVDFVIEARNARETG